MKLFHKIILDRVKIMEQAISTNVPNLKSVRSSYFLFNSFIKICIDLMKALVVFTISKLLLDQIIFPFFYYTVTARTEIMFSLISSYETFNHTKQFSEISGTLF